MLSLLGIFTFVLATPLLSWFGLRDQKSKAKMPQWTCSYEYVCGEWMEVTEMPTDDFLRLQEML